MLELGTLRPRVIGVGKGVGEYIRVYNEEITIYRYKWVVWMVGYGRNTADYQTTPSARKTGLTVVLRGGTVLPPLQYSVVFERILQEGLFDSRKNQTNIGSISRLRQTNRSLSLQ